MGRRQASPSLSQAADTLGVRIDAAGHPQECTMIIQVI